MRNIANLRERVSLQANLNCALRELICCRAPENGADGRLAKG